MREVLITGGAGFIGSNIQDRLIESGDHVSVVDNFHTGDTKNINPQAQSFSVDICDAASLSSVIERIKPNIIIHTAGQLKIPYSMRYPHVDLQINIVGTMNVLEASVQHNVQKVIFTNTGGALYGDQPSDKLPVVEDEKILKPTSFYAVSKMAAEQYIKLFGNVYDLPWVSLRLSNIYGPRQDGSGECGIIAIFVRKMLQDEQPIIHGDGKNTRDYVYIDDVVNATVKAIDHPNPDYFNISSGSETSNLEIFEAVKQATGSTLEPQFGPADPGDVLRSSLSNQKAKELLDWSPTTSLSEGIQQTVYQYRSKSHS